MAHPVVQSSLEELIACVHYRVVLCLDEGALCALGSSCRWLADVAEEQALWQRLAMCRDRLVAARFLGLLSREAGEGVSSEDPRPSVPRSRGGNGPGDALLGGGLVDWRDVCRQLNSAMAERPWEFDACEDDCSSSLWTELMDGSRGAVQQQGPAAPDTSQVHTGSILASQSPHLLWIGGNRLLAIAGGYSPDPVGGAILHPLREVYMLDLPDTSCGSEDGDPCAELRAMRLDCGTAGGRLPNGHPSMNGAASDFDPVRKTAYFFGGGAPHSDVNSATSALRLQGWEVGAGDVAPTARWEVVDCPGSAEAGQVPCARQGLRGTVCCDEFIIFGGRKLGGECLNDVWSLDLTGDGGSSSSSSGQSAPTWRQLACEGSAPSPRVWYCACQAVHGRWFIYGGSTWQFEEPTEEHDYCTLYVLDLSERRWSSVDPRPGPQPPWGVAAALVPLGSCQLLLLGGTLPHKLGLTGLNAQSLRHWRTWYNRLDVPFVYDLGTQEWSERRAAVAPPEEHVDPELHEQHVAEVYLRSHFAACFVPHRRSVVVFGGSRYFTGEYFNDLLELQLPSSSSQHSGRRCGHHSPVLGEGRDEESRRPVCGAFQAPNALPRHLQPEQRMGATATRGYLGRLQGMVHDRIISQEQLDLIRAPE